MDAPALAPIVGQGANAQAPENAFGGNEDDQDANSQGTPSATSYAGVHGPALAALDAKLKATAVANASLKGQQLAITAQRELIGKQQQTDQAALELATQKHALEVQNSPAGALSMSSGQAPTSPTGALSNIGGPAAANEDWKTHAANFDADQHLKDANYTQAHWDEANANLKANTGKTAHEMYDELEKKGLVLPSSADLTNKQKGELFLKFGMNLMKAHQPASIALRSQWKAPNPMGEIGAAGAETMADYDKIVQQQRESALKQYEDRQKIGMEAAGKQSDLERAIEERKAQAEMWGARTASQEKQTTEKVEAKHEDVGTQTTAKVADTQTNAAQRAKSTADSTAERAKAAADRTAVSQQRADTDAAKTDTKKDDKQQAELDKEQTAAQARAAKEISTYSANTYHTVDADGKDVPKGTKGSKRAQYTEDELAAQYAAKSPAHQRAAATTAPQPKAGEKPGGPQQTATGAKGEKYLLVNGAWVEQK